MPLRPARGIRMSALHRPVEEVSAWQSVRLEEPGVAAADKNALGTTARVVAWPPEQLAHALGAVDRELMALDAQASRFRQDSEISQLNRSGNEQFFISDGLAEAIAAASGRRLLDGWIGRPHGRAGARVMGLRPRFRCTGTPRQAFLSP